MKLLTLFALALGASALPTNGGHWGNCLSDADAQNYVTQSITFLQHTDLDAARAAAYSIFDPAIVEFGDSINALRGDPVGTQVENGITQYVTETLSAPGVPQINTLDIVHNCHTIVWHWEFIGIGPQRVRGYTLAKVNEAGKVYYQSVEFNSLTWAVDIGFTVTPPATGPFSGSG